MCERGLVIPGSNVVKDSVNNLPYRCIDTSEWLIERSILLAHPIPSDFSFEEWVQNKAEDDKLQMRLMAAGVRIRCDEEISLRYYLGGYSTSEHRKCAHSERWVWNGDDEANPSLSDVR
jgi:hypothetical protein